MTHPIRPVNTFILRLWREPGDQEGDAGWRGLIRPLDAGAASQDEVIFYGLAHLLEVLRPLLIDKTRPARSSSDAADTACRKRP